MMAELILILFLARPPEAELVQRVAMELRGKTEVQLHDGSRADVVTDTTVYECDFTNKWAESIGQSLHYSSVLQKRAGVVLFMNDPHTEWQELVRAARVCGQLNIDLRIYRY